MALSLNALLATFFHQVTSAIFLCRQNLKLMLSEIQSVKEEKQLEMFLIKHGEQIVDCLGAEVMLVMLNNTIIKYSIRSTGLRGT